MGLAGFEVLGLKARDKARGEMGEPGESEDLECSWKRDGFDGERERERRICLMEGKPSRW